MIPVIETTKHRKAPVARAYSHLLSDPEAVQERIRVLVAMAEDYFDARAPAIAGEKLLEAGLIARAHAKRVTKDFMEAAAQEEENPDGED